jgi:hypothetical protein
MNSNPLLAVWQSYQASKNAFEIAKAANKHPDRENLFVKADDLRLFIVTEFGNQKIRCVFFNSLYSLINVADCSCGGQKKLAHPTNTHSLLQEKI